MGFEKLTEYINSLEEKYGIHGADCKITKGHEVVYRHMAGHSDYDMKVPVSDQDLYHLYSATKVITMIAVMQLVDQNKVCLYDEVSRYLPEFTYMKVADDFQSCAFPPQWPTKDTKCHLAHNRIRIIDLMSMTAGLTYDVTSDYIMQLKEESNNQASTREVVAAIAKMPLIFEPGTRWSYSLGHDVLGAVVEVISKESYGDYLKKYIFEPLGICDFYFHLDENLEKRLSAQYAADFHTKKIEPVENINRYKLTDRYESSGAGLAGSVDAYSAVIAAISNHGVGENGNRILSEESIRLLSTNYVTGKMLEDFKGTGKIGYGYGLGVRVLIEEDKSESPLGEFGWDGAAGAYVVIDPVNQISIFYVQQILGFITAYDTIHPMIRDLAYEAMKL